MLQGILSQCCFPQLSYLSANVRELIRIDFLSALPAEVSYRILCHLDTSSLCKASQVSRKWRELAEDDVVWHRMCEQHIDRRCTKCGWGLPLMEKKRLRDSKRQIQLRAAGRGVNEWSPNITPEPEAKQLVENEPSSTATSTNHPAVVSSRSTSLSPVVSKKRPSLPASSESEYTRRTRPWKDVYKDRFKIGTNWKYGRCSLQILKGHDNGVMCLQFMDNRLATGSYDSTIKIWDLDTGKEIRTLRGHLEGLRCLQLDENILISGSLDKTIKIWDWRTGKCVRTLNQHQGGVIGLHFQKPWLVSGSIDGTAILWNLERSTYHTLRGHDDWVNHVRLDLVSRTVFTASDDTTIKMWDMDTKKCIRTFEGHRGQVQSIQLLHHEFDDDSATSPLEPDHYTDDDAQSISTGSVSPELTRKTLTSDDRRFNEVFACYNQRPKPPRYMLTASLDASIRMWDTQTGKCLKTMLGHIEGVWCLAADSIRLVSGSQDSTVKVWDPRSGACEKTFTGHAGPVTCIGLSDSRMVTGGEDGEVRMYSFGNEC